MVKIAIYCRVSKDEKFEDHRYQETDNQLIPLRNYASSRGYEIYKEYIDRESGANPNRPSFKQMFKDAYMGYFKVILVWKLDRFSREPMLVVLSYIDQLKNRGVGVVSLTESWFDTTQENPMTEVVLAILTWAAAEERRKISERTKAGIARRRNIGQWKGGRPRKRGVVDSIVETTQDKETVV